MLKLFNRKKKDNKGFTLVELVIVVAILAILVGILAPQYTKYVEKSRQAADVSNLDDLVKGFKVAAADSDYNIVPSGTTSVATFKIEIASTGTTITATGAPDADTNATNNWIGAMKEYTGFTFVDGEPNDKIKLKSKKWKSGTDKNTTSIVATVVISSDASVSVTYDPETIMDVSNKTNN